MSVIDDLVKFAGPFAEAFAQQLVAETADDSKAAGVKAGEWIKDKLLGTKTTADDVLITGNLKAFAEGLLESLNTTSPNP